MQFLGAGNDNLFKFAFTVLVTDQLQVPWLPEGMADLLIGALFILPFMLFSATSGQLADKLEKSRLAWRCWAAGQRRPCRTSHSPATVPGLQINWNPFTETWRNLVLARQDTVVSRSLLGISWMWFFGAVFLANFPALPKGVLHGDAHVASLLLVVFSVGVGIGALLCEVVSRRHVDIGLVPAGAIGMSVFGIDLYFAARSLPAVAVQGLGAFLAQPARIIAANNILNALFMIVSALGAGAMLGAGYSVPEVFLATALLNLLVGADVFLLVPEYLLRLNMDHRIFGVPVLGWLFRLAKAIPIAPERENPAVYAAAFAAADRVLADGDLLCIFPEGSITRDGRLQPFQGGVMKILQRRAVAGGAGGAAQPVGVVLLAGGRQHGDGAAAAARAVHPGGAGGRAGTVARRVVARQPAPAGGAAAADAAAERAVRHGRLPATPTGEGDVWSGFKRTV